ncbi:MAG: ATP-dependent DNA ligase [Deltaproteobacteria bacterium]|nr:ATP-dependent DNA ligase [Deltaproteobacteria bacterium]
MRAFAAVFDQLDRTTSTNAKVEAMAAYFASAPPAEAAWAFFLLSGRRMKRLIGPRKLGGWALAEAALPEWLMDECYAAVGDLAEVISLLVERTEPHLERSLPEWVEALKALRSLEEDEQHATVTKWWRSLPKRERFLLNKLLTGALRVGVSKTLAIRALAEATGIDRDVLQHRLSGKWAPSAKAWATLVDPEPDAEASAARPYPFYLASPLEAELESLGDPSDWLVEWKWDGIRAQLVRRGGETFLWSRGEELITERFPEIVNGSAALADGTVLDGELLAWDADAKRPLPFAKLQKRIGRKKLGPKILREAPAHFMAYDLLELGGEDQRERPQTERRADLERVVAGLHEEGLEARFGISERVAGESWEALAALHAESRARGVEGFMLKSAAGPYRTGRRKGEWWKHKVDPFTLDCVLIYAQAGSGKRAGLFTDYTFALRSAEHGLVPIAKAYSGLDDAEIRELDGWIRSHTLERFGPVRAVAPEHVFEIAFEDIRVSKRHKAGLAVRFPRIARWRRDKTAADADSIESALQLLATKND